jgi:N-acetylglucosaminyldiphosphoundecaprenol N-acetyl-beta-D-mannosaminyltransferase
MFAKDIHEAGCNMCTVNTESILGFPIYKEPYDACMQQISIWLEHREQPRLIACANPHSLVIASGDPLFQKALLSADILVPDGAGIVLASKVLDGNICNRITGTDVFLGVNALLNTSKGSIFFLGSSEKNLTAIRTKMSTEYPGIRIVGTYSPPFKEIFSSSDNDAMIQAINTVHPDVLWVGMTAPKQEKWIHQNLNRLDVKLAGAIGAVFDFYTGNVARPHPAFQKLGLEWLPRLIKEPKRLWRRSFISAPIFLSWVVKAKLEQIRKGITRRISPS